MKAVLFALLLGSASGFAPLRSSRVQMSLNGAGGDYLKTMSGGASPETGGQIPPWAMNIADAGTPATMEFFRAAEIKHGRIAMWAFAGWCVALAHVHFPGYLSISEGITFESLSAMSPIDAFFGLPQSSLGQIFGFVSLFEWLDMTHKDFKYTGNNVLNGDFKAYNNVFDFYKQLPSKSAAQLEEIKLKELKNGRLAMWGVLSFTCAASIPGSVPFLSGLF